MGLLESIRSFIWCQFLACSLFILLFGWHFFQGDFLTALMYLSGSMVTALSLLISQNSSKNHLQILSSIIFAIYTLISLLLPLIAPQESTHSYLSLYLAYTLLAFTLLPFRIALLFILVFSVLANLLLMLQLEGTFRAAYIITFWLSILLTSLHRFAYFTRQEALHKQLNRDPRTQLLNHQQLLVDLQKEQERAQREATFLGVICLVGEKDFDLYSAKELASFFAPYESIYSAAANKLVALIPIAAPKELKAREKKLIKQLPNLKLESQLSSLDKPLTDYLKTVPIDLRPLYE